MKMKQQPNLRRIQLWIDALRSGDYAQCREELSTGTGNSRAFCCLGVACEVAIRAGLSELRAEKQGDGSWLYYRDAGGSIDPNRISNEASDWSGGELPWLVADWYGIPRDPELRTGEVRYEDDQSDPDNPDGAYEFEASATSLNDDEGYTFTRIADALERTYFDPTSGVAPAGADGATSH